MAGGFANLYMNGDMVLRNPKESAVIFVVVVMLSVMLEKLFHYFRHHHSKYVRLMFGQVSEELQCVGFIALGIMFFAASIVDELPPNWFLLFEWTHMVLFFMMIFFVINVCITVVYIKNVIASWARYEMDLAPGEFMPNKNLGTRVRKFFSARALFKKQLHVMYGEGVMSSVPFAKYLQITTRGMIVKFTDITWMCWGSLTFAAIANSIREYVIPGKLQSKPLTEFDTTDRLWNQISFIVVLGYGPLAVFLFTVFKLQANFTQYLESASEQKNEKKTTHGDHRTQTAKLQVGDRSVFIDADAFSEALLHGEALEDPSRYLIRGSLTLTLHLLKIPLLLLEFYLSIFMLGMLYEVAVAMEVFRYILLPAALIPLVICLMFLPWAILMITILCSVGSKMKERTLYQLLEKQHRKAGHGHNENEDDEEHSDGDVEESSDGEGEHGHGDGGHGDDHHGHDMAPIPHPHTPPKSPKKHHHHTEQPLPQGLDADNVMTAAELEILQKQRVSLIEKIQAVQGNIYALLSDGDFKSRDEMLHKLENEVRCVRIEAPTPYEKETVSIPGTFGGKKMDTKKKIPIARYNAVALKEHLKTLRSMTDVYL